MQRNSGKEVQCVLRLELQPNGCPVAEVWQGWPSCSYCALVGRQTMGKLGSAFGHKRQIYGAGTLSLVPTESQMAHMVMNIALVGTFYV